MKYFTYILYSNTKNRYYTGSTSDIDKRLERHNNGATPSTKPGRPWKVVYSETYSSKTEAIKRENHLKKMKSRLYIEDLIKDSGIASSAG